VDWREIQALVGISRASYYRWKRSLKDQGLKELVPKPKRLKRLRQKVHWIPGVFLQSSTKHSSWASTIPKSVSARCVSRRGRTQ